jgi:hypothetical protein
MITTSGKMVATSGKRITTSGKMVATSGHFIFKSFLAPVPLIHVSKTNYALQSTFTQQFSQ